jgi:hypothetical protein
LHRGIAGAAEADSAGNLRVEVEERPDEVPPRTRTREIEREYRAVVEEILELRGDDGRIRAFVRSITGPGALADTAGYSPDLTFEQKVELLQTLDVVERLELATRLQRERLAELQVRKRIRDDVESGAQKQQREYFLRRQMDSIRKELGEDDESVASEYRMRSATSGSVTSGRSNIAAIVSVVRSSAVGPSPPVAITRWACRNASLHAQRSRSGRSPTVRIATTSTPSSSSLSAMKPAFVSVVRPVVSSSPVLMIAASIT